MTPFGYPALLQPAAKEQDYPCGAFISNRPDLWCELRSDHDGEHVWVRRAKEQGWNPAEVGTPDSPRACAGTCPIPPPGSEPDLRAELDCVTRERYTYKHERDAAREELERVKAELNQWHLSFGLNLAAAEKHHDEVAAWRDTFKRERDEARATLESAREIARRALQRARAQAQASEVGAFTIHGKSGTLRLTSEQARIYRESLEEYEETGKRAAYADAAKRARDMAHRSGLVGSSGRSACLDLMNELDSLAAPPAAQEQAGTPERSSSCANSNDDKKASPPASGIFDRVAREWLTASWYGPGPTLMANLAALLRARFGSAISTLEIIERWQLPEVPGRGAEPPCSYGAAYGSNGERDYIKAQAHWALEKLRASAEGGAR